MIYGKKIVIETMKSIFLSAVLFTLFDIFSQGYSNYHDWIISAFAIVGTLYYLVSRSNNSSIS